MNDEIQDEASTDIELINEDISKYEEVKRLGDSMIKLMDTPEFTELFEEMYLKAYRETSAYNVALFNEEGKKAYLYNIVSRSHFERFCASVIAEGVQAGEILDDLYEGLKEETKLQNAGDDSEEHS